MKCTLRPIVAGGAPCPHKAKQMAHHLHFTALRAAHYLSAQPAMPGGHGLARPRPVGRCLRCGLAFHKTTLRRITDLFHRRQTSNHLPREQHEACRQQPSRQSPARAAGAFRSATLISHRPTKTAQRLGASTSRCIPAVAHSRSVLCFLMRPGGGEYKGMNKGGDKSSLAKCEAQEI